MAGPDADRAEVVQSEARAAIAQAQANYVSYLHRNHFREQGGVSCLIEGTLTAGELIAVRSKKGKVKEGKGQQGTVDFVRAKCKELGISP